jgi:AmmeMemoRadiSam system protein A
MNEPEATAENGKLLLALARGAIAAELEPDSPAPAPEPPDPLPGWLASPGASFVTLQLDGELRGCIGSLQPHRPLHEDVAHNARAAAFGDPRFGPLSDEEYPRVKLEVSVLSPLTPMPVADEADACARLRPGIDGLVLERGSRRATFLPQVWEELPKPEDFLRHLKLKGGWPGEYWSSDMKLFRYSVYKFREDA